MVFHLIMRWNTMSSSTVWDEARRSKRTKEKKRGEKGDVLLIYVCLGEEKCRNRSKKRSCSCCFHFCTGSIKLGTGNGISCISFFCFCSDQGFDLVQLNGKDVSLGSRGINQAEDYLQIHGPNGGTALSEKFGHWSLLSCPSKKIILTLSFFNWTEGYFKGSHGPEKFPMPLEFEHGDFVFLGSKCLTSEWRGILESHGSRVFRHYGSLTITSLLNEPFLSTIFLLVVHVRRFNIDIL